MRNSAFFITIASLGLCFMLLFQNCSQMESKGSEFSFTQNESQSGDPIINNEPIDPLPIVDPLPVVADFGPRFTLDNVDNTVSTSYSIGQGSGDVFYYETDYKSSTQLTVVTFQQVGASNIINVTTDSCNQQAVIGLTELTQFGSLYGLFSADAQPRVLAAGEVVTPNCAFPRFGIDAQGTKNDYELYFADRACVPSGSYYNTNHVTMVTDWFNTQIDTLCP